MPTDLFPALQLFVTLATQIASAVSKLQGTSEQRLAKFILVLLDYLDTTDVQLAAILESLRAYNRMHSIPLRVRNIHNAGNALRELDKTVIGFCNWLEVSRLEVKIMNIFDQFELPKKLREVGGINLEIINLTRNWYAKASDGIQGIDNRFIDPNAAPPAFPDEKATNQIIESIDAVHAQVHQAKLQVSKFASEHLRPVHFG